MRAAELYRDRPPIPDEDNAFIYVMGLDVAPGEDPRRMGLARVAWLQSASDSSPLDASKDPLGKPHDFRAGRDPAVQAFLDACKPVDAKCPVAFDGAQAIFDQWAASEPWLLERYSALIAHTGWRESVPSGLAKPFPSFQSAMHGQKLLLLKAKMLARKGDHAGVKALLTNDLRFWRRVLASSDLLISKMVATVAINRHFEMGNLVLRDFEPGGAANAVPPEWHVGVSDAERSMLRCMVGEWVYASGIMKSEALGTARISGKAADPLFNAALELLVSG